MLLPRAYVPVCKWPQIYMFGGDTRVSSAGSSFFCHCGLFDCGGLRDGPVSDNLTCKWVCKLMRLHRKHELHVQNLFRGTN